MIKSSKNYLLALLILVTMSIVSCGGEDEEPTQSITVSTNTIDLGDVLAGTVATAEFTVSATQVGTLTVTGDNYELDITSFVIPNISNTITLSFSPDSDATAGSSSAEITITAGDLSETISVTATIVEPEVPFLASGTVIYSNDFTFDPNIAHGDSLIVSDLDLTATVLEGVTAEHAIVNYMEEDGTATRIGATYQMNFSLCDDTIVDGTATSDDQENDFSCGAGITIQGVVTGSATSVSFKMNGLLPDQPVLVTYWLRPNGDSQRGFDAFFTGAETVSHVFENTTGVDGWNRTYTRYTITGSADENGEVTFLAQMAVPLDEVRRGISIDNLSIVVP